MISTKAKKLFCNIIRLGYACGFISFDWNRQSDSLELKKSSVPRALWRLYLVTGLLGYEIYLIARCTLVLSDSTADTKSQIQLLYATVVTALLCVNHWVHIFREEDYVKLVNGFRTLVLQNRSEGGKSGKTVRYMRLVSFIAVFGSVTISLLAVIRPTSTRVITSLAVNPQKLPLALKIAAAMFHLSINCYHYYALCLQTSSIFLIASDVIPVINKLNAERFRGPGIEFARRYRSLAILLLYVASIYGQWIVVMEVINLTVVILNIFQAVVLGNRRAFVLAFTVGTGFCWTMKEIAGLYEASVGVLTSWERRTNLGDYQWRKRFLKSCHPVSVPVGRFFFIDRQLILTVLAIVIDTSVSLILAYQ